MIIFLRNHNIVIIEAKQGKMYFFSKNFSQNHSYIHNPKYNNVCISRSYYVNVNRWLIIPFCVKTTASV